MRLVKPRKRAWVLAMGLVTTLASSCARTVVKRQPQTFDQQIAALFPRDWVVHSAFYIDLRGIGRKQWLVALVSRQKETEAFPPGILEAIAILEQKPPGERWRILSMELHLAAWLDQVVDDIIQSRPGLEIAVWSHGADNIALKILTVEPDWRMRPAYDKGLRYKPELQDVDLDGNMEVIEHWYAWTVIWDLDAHLSPSLLRHPVLQRIYRWDGRKCSLWRRFRPDPRFEATLTPQEREEAMAMVRRVLKER